MAGRRYSAGRIFLDVIPSFRGVIRETEREVEKLRAQVAKDNEKAAEDDEKGQAKVRSRTRLKSERETNKLVEDEAEAHWKRLSRQEKLQQAAQERARRRAALLARRNSLDGLMKQLEEADRRTQAAARDAERSRVAHEKRVANIISGIHIKAGQEMWKAVQDDARKAALEQEKARRAQELKEEKERLAHEEQVARAIRGSRIKAAQDMWREVQENAKAERKRFETEQKAHLKRLADEQVRQAKIQGGRAGQELREALRHALADLPEADLSLNSDKVNKEVDALRARLERLRTMKIGVEISGKDALAELKVLERQAKALDRKDVDIAVRTNAKGVNAILREQITVMTAAGRRATDLGNRHKRSGRDAQDAANAFRIFSWRILGITLLIPMLIPMIGALAGAIGSLIPMALGAGAGLGVLILGLTGLAPAVQAMGDVQQNAAKDALAYEKTMRNSSRAVRDAQQGLTDAARDAARAREDSARRVQDAQRGVVDAERQAARAAEDSARRVRDAREALSDATDAAARDVQDALRKVKDAEQDLARAQRDSAEAQRDLQRAREDAEQQLRDMALRAEGGALAERQARLDLQAAKFKYDASRSPLSTATVAEREEVAIEYGRADLALRQIIEDNRQLAEEMERANREGVEGSERVRDARDRVTEANERQRQSQQALRDAEAAVNQTRVEAAERVADAQQAVTDALRDQAQQQVDSSRAIADARRDVADALADQRRQQEDTADAMRDANERLADAQAAYQEALTKTGDIGSASMQKLEQAMADLGPEGRAFAAYLYSLREPLMQLRRDVQAGLLPGVQEFMQDMGRVYGPAFAAWAADMGVVLGNIFRQMSDVFQSPLMRAFFDSMEQYAGVFTQQVATVLLNLMQVIAGLSTAFAPFSKDLGDALVRITAGWAEWAGSLADSEGFYKFMSYVERVGPIVVDLFVALGKALINLGVGLAPYGEMLIGWAENFFTWIASADPKVVGAIAAGIIGIVVAIQLAAGAMTLLSGASLFFSRNAAGSFASPLALIVLAFIGLVAVIAIARDNFEGFREVTDRIGNALKAFAEYLWEHRETILKVATVVVGVVATFYTLRTALTYAKVGFQVLGAVMKVFGLTSLAAVGWVAVIVVAIALLVAGFVSLWKNNETFRNKVITVWDQIRAAWDGVVEWFTKDGLPALKKGWDALVEGFKWAWKNILKPVWDELVKVGEWAAEMFVDNVLPAISDAFMILWGVIEMVWLWVVRSFEDAVEDWQNNSGLMTKVLKGLWEFLKSFYKEGVKPLFRAIGDTIEWVWDNLINPTFRNIRRGVEVMVEAFRSGESLIGSIWQGIVAGVQGPASQLVKLVNKYLVGPLNKVLDAVGISWRIPNLPDVPEPARRQAPAPARGSRGGGTTGVGMAATGTSHVGDVLPGYSPGIDNIRFTSPMGDLLLSGGEGILRPEVVRAVSPQWVDAANYAARTGGVDEVRRRVLGAHRFGTSDIDFSGLPRVPKTDIVLPKPPKGKSLWEKFTDLVSLIDNPVQGFKKVVSGLVGFLPRGEMLPEFVRGAFLKMGGLLGAKAKDLVGANAKPVGNQQVNYGGPYGWNPNVSGQTWPTIWSLIRAAAPEATMTSNYRPGAITASGVPSLHGQGRAVDIVSPNMAETFRKIRGLRKWSQLFYSPMGNLQIGYRDATVHRTHFDHIHAGYNQGGVFDRSPFDMGLFDTGGILDHGDLGINLSGKPEAVLTNDQWQAIDRASRALHQGGVGGEGGPLSLDEDTLDRLWERAEPVLRRNSKAMVKDMIDAGRKGL